MSLRMTKSLLILCTFTLAWSVFATISVYAADTITLGAAVSFTGKYSTNGKHTKNGYDLAVKRINENGGVKVGDNTYLLQIIYYDDESTPARGAQLIERLINQDKVNFILGPYSSGLTKAIAPVTEKYKVPMVEATAPRAHYSPRVTATCSRFSPPPNSISSRPLIWLRSRHVPWVRTRQTYASPACLKTTPSHRTSGPECWTTPNVTA